MAHGSSYLQYNQFNNTSGGSPIYNTMNTTVYNSLSSDLKSQISTTRWYFKSVHYNTCQNCSLNGSFSTNNLYNYERNGYSYWGNGYADFNVGLINTSDFRYATLASVCNRTSNIAYSGSNCGHINYNWISNTIYNSTKGTYTWVLNGTYYTDSSNGYHGREDLYCNSSSNYCYNNSWSYTTNSYVVFPVFYLKNNVKLIKGTGLQSNPYYIYI